MYEEELDLAFAKWESEQYEKWAQENADALVQEAYESWASTRREDGEDDSYAAWEAYGESLLPED